MKDRVMEPAMRMNKEREIRSLGFFNLGFLEGACGGCS